MISLELAKKLKDAGLVWEPKVGDWFLIKQFDGNVIKNPELFDGFSWGPDCDWDVWLPSLSQLMVEIEQRYPNFRITKLLGVWSLDLFDLGIKGEFIGDTPGDAAGKALLWILRQEVSNESSD